MSKLLRLPLTVLAVLAALFFLPGIAFGNPPPTAEQCATDPAPQGCPAPSVGDVVNGPGQPAGGADQPATKPDQAGAPAGQQQPAGSQGDVVPANRLAGIPPVSGPEAAIVDPPTPAAPAAPPGICTLIPTFPTCPGAANPPSGPLTCDQLAALLGATGCPAGLSCQQLAALLGVTCPAGPPSCEALAALFHLEGCPAPPTSCQEFADLLGIDNCSQIPCLDTSQLPAQARDGLQPLLDGLKNIGIKECPAKPVPTTPGKGTYMPPIQPAAQQPPPPAATAQPVAATTPTVTTTAQPAGRLAYTGTDIAPQLKLAWTLLMLGTGLLIVGRRRA